MSFVISTLTQKLVDLAWAAGFVDGEGCIRIVRRQPPKGNPIYSLEVTVSQNCLRTLQHLQATLGVAGSVYLYPCCSPVRSPVWGLTYRCGDAAEVLRLLLPFLVRKKREAALGAAFARRVATVRVGGRTPHTPKEIALRERVYRRMRALKIRGVGAV